MTWKFLENTMKKPIAVRNQKENITEDYEEEEEEEEESKVIHRIVKIKEKPQIVNVNIVKIECFKCFLPKRNRLYTYDED